MAPPRPDFARTLASLAQVAPGDPPRSVAHGLELTHRLRALVGERGGDRSLWDELLELRTGPGVDAFFASPLPADTVDDPLLDRAVELIAIVEAIRSRRHAHDSQPLDRYLRHGRLVTRRVPMAAERVPVAVRCGRWFTVLEVGDEHPRVVRDRIAAAMATPRALTRRRRRVPAAVLVCLSPVPFEEAVHAHRLGLEGPWLSWSHTAGCPSMGVLAAHHLVLEGPGFAAVRADFRRRVRALRVALGLETDGDPTDELYLDSDAAPFRPWGSGELELDVSLAELADERRTPPPAPAVPRGMDGLTEGLEPLAIGPAPSLRYATVHRYELPLVDLCYAYCRAKHETLLRFDRRYEGGGFTFIVPRQLPGGRRGQPVLCALHAPRGTPESSTVFRARLHAQLRASTAGEDLLTGVLEEALRLAVPRPLQAAAVSCVERLPKASRFLAGRGLVACIDIPDDVVDPYSRYAGHSEGLFGGSCQERDGVALTAVGRGDRRDLCAVGTGVFRAPEVIDYFWRRLAWWLDGA